ncbi:unnamed protein product [Protopolystoma xenopodis]|uniref:Uncharacterized protein n=1 Tax=Protopolystoma xenopodis TaxID=117903 RepID=A0A3S5BZE8_9PLAT|nr:unnamed protein product [Protopolystoma xenopodis]
MPARFSATTFIALLACVMAISLVAFTLLDLLPSPRGLGVEIRQYYLKANYLVGQMPRASVCQVSMRQINRSR